jgi:hypothetical protein
MPGADQQPQGEFNIDKDRLRRQNTNMRTGVALVLFVLVLSVSAPLTFGSRAFDGTASLAALDVCGGSAQVLSPDGDNVAITASNFALLPLSFCSGAETSGLLLLPSVSATLLIPPPRSSSLISL